MRKAKAIKKYWLNIFLVCGIAVFPVVLDRLYGMGCLGFFPNAFPADAWFSFIGSYFPAMIIGYITIYQAHVIREKDRQYQALLELHRFLPAGQVQVSRYSDTAKQIGGLDIAKLEEMWQADHHQALPAGWKEGYLIKFDFYDTVGKAITDIRFHELVWHIAQEHYPIEGKICTSMEWHHKYNGTYSIILFCLLPSNEQKFKKEAKECFLYAESLLLNYLVSVINLTLQIEENGKTYLLGGRFEMISQQNNICQIISRVENFSCEVKEKA